MLVEQAFRGVAAAICVYSHLALGFSVNARQKDVKFVIVGGSGFHGAEGNCM